MNKMIETIRKKSFAYTMANIKKNFYKDDS